MSEHPAVHPRHASINADGVYHQAREEAQDDAGAAWELAWRDAAWAAAAPRLDGEVAAVLRQQAWEVAAGVQSPPVPA